MNLNWNTLIELSPKRVARFILRKTGVSASKPYRMLRTGNYKSGRLALGEQNLYGGLPHSFVTVDHANADFNFQLWNLERFPFDNGSFEFVYSSHMVEHIDTPSLRKLLNECFRVMKKGGVIRIETPDARKLVAAYRAQDLGFYGRSMNHSARLVQENGLPAEIASLHLTFLAEFSSHFLTGHILPPIVSKEEIDEKLSTLSLDEFSDWAVSLLTEEERKSGGHINAFYYEKLRDLLAEAGFVNIENAPFGHTRVFDKSVLEIERPHRQYLSVIAEAEKP